MSVEWNQRVKVLENKIKSLDDSFKRLEESLKRIELLMVPPQVPAVMRNPRKGSNVPPNSANSTTHNALRDADI